MRLAKITANRLHRGAIPPLNLAVTEPILVITGPNESGKTTLLRLLDLVASGPTGKAWPILGDSPDYQFEAALHLSGDGSQVVVARGQDHKAKHWLTLDGRPGNLKDVQGQVSAALGEAAAFSLADFTGLTPQKRLAWMEQRILGTGGWDLDRLREEIAKRQLGAAFEDAGLSQEIQGSARDGLVALIARAKEAKLEAQREKTRLSAAVAQQSTATGDLPPGTVGEWTARLDGLKAEKADLDTRRGRIQASKEAIAAHEKGKDAIARAIAEATDALGQAVAQCGLEQAKLPGLRKTAAELRSATEAPMAALKTANTALEEARDALGKQEADAPTAQDLRAKAVELREFMELRRFDEDTAATTEFLEQVATLLDNLLRLPDRTVLDQPVEAVETAKRILGEAMRAADAAARAVDTVEREVGQLKRREKQERDNLARLQVQAAEMERAALEAGAISGEDETREALANVVKSIGEAEHAIDVLHTAADDRARLLTWQADLDAAERTRGACSVLEKGLAGVLEALLTETVAPFVEPISAITRDTIGCDAYVDLEGGAEFGCLRPNGTKIPWSTCSESQQAILLLAFSIAIQGRLGGAWKRLVVDGLECMDRERRTAFLVAMRRAVDRGQLDNVICATVADGWEPPVEAGAQVEVLAR